MAIFERESRGGRCVCHIGYQVSPNRRSQLGIVADQVRVTVLSIVVERFSLSCETFYLLSKTVKGWSRNALAVDAQTSAEFEASFLHLGSTESFYSELVEFECDDILGEPLGLDDNQPNNLYFRA